MKVITVNGEKLAWSERMTVQDVLDAKNFSFRLISVWINGEPVQNRGDYQITPVPDEAEVDVVHMISGGQGKDANVG
jgi:sulfur carrier protein